MRKKIIISATNDLSGDQRVYKTASTLFKLGFDIICVGRKLNNSSKINFEYKTKRFKLLFNKGFLFYAEYNFRLFIFLIFSKADMYLANDLDTLVANFLASKIKKKKLIYDSHEYFTEVPELINRKFVKRIWEIIEKFTLPKIKYSYTVCESIAGIYNKKYGIDMKVVRNIPLCDNNHKSIKFEKNVTKNKTIIYQGALNIGRGLEQFVEAMLYTKGMEFLIIGDGDIKNKLEMKVKNLNLEQKVFFKGKLQFNELYKYTVNADLGISIEENIGLNYYYALPNKIFDYIKAETPIFASRLPEIEKIILKYEIGEFIENHNPKHLAEKLTMLLNSKEKLKFYSENTKKAKKELCWEKEFLLILDLFKE